MTALILDHAAARPLARASLAACGGYDEKWLQALLFEHPNLIPITLIDPGATTLVPICRELPLPKPGGNVFLDLLAVTPQGRLVLVECKLWRNPQARREVIAQILEYAALLRQWSYADLTARLKASLHWTGANPIFEHVRRALPELQESRFVDAVSRSLLAGDFDLIVAGDGIRSDLQAIAGHLNGHTGSIARLALVEFQLWSDPGGQTVVIPAVPLRTEIIEQRVLLDRDGLPIPLAQSVSEEETEMIIDPTRSAERDRQRDNNRAFWQQFIDTVHFDHPDQPPPRHGGKNWVKIDLPAPATWMTAYRMQDGRAGLFINIKDAQGAVLFEQLEEDADLLQQETGFFLTFSREAAQPFWGKISVEKVPVAGETLSDAEVLSWLTDAANRLVNTFRPRLASAGR